MENAIVLRRGPDGRDLLRIHFNKALKKWTIPFIMAPVNTRVVRRSNALLHHSYGELYFVTNVLSYCLGVAGMDEGCCSLLSLLPQACVHIFVPSTKSTVLPSVAHCYHYMCLCVT